MIGRTLSHYEVVESLGAGGMGEVYRARDSRLGRDVAIKVLPPHRTLDETSRRRFQREAMAASSLNHPNIITIYEINSEGDTDFIVMEYVRGVTLSSRLKRSGLSIDEVVAYASQIADALVKAHSAGIVHRDLKPGNVMITEDDLVKVLDFGLAKFDSAETHTSDSADDQTTGVNLSISLPGMVTGTIAYMSPEQARGDRVEARSDIFSFGIVLFEMLSRQLPFMGPNAIAQLHNIHFSPPRNLLELRPDVPPGLESLIFRMLEKEPERRPSNMTVVAAVLRGGTKTPGGASSAWSSEALTMDEIPSSATLGQLQAGRKIRQRIAWGVAAVTLIVALGLGGYFLKKKMTAKAAVVSEATVAAAEEDNAFALYKQGRQELDHFDRPGAVDHAIRHLERAIELDPQSAASFAALADAYYQRNRANPDPQWIKLTSQYAQRAMELNPDLAASHIAAGLAGMQVGHAAEAEKQFRAAATLDPKSGAALRWLGILYDKNGKGSEALNALNHALQLEPDDWRIYMEFALNRFQTADYKGAATNWEHALKLEPDNLDALESLGGVYQKLDRNDDAATALQHALEIKPDADTYNNLGNLRFNQGRYQDAVAAFEKTVALSANRYDNWGDLADAYRWAPGHTSKAKQAYQQAIQLVREEIMKAPEQADLRAHLAMYLAKSGETEPALQELKTLERVQQKDPAVLYIMSIGYELCQKRDKSLDTLVAALKAGQSMADLKSEPELAGLRADPRYHLRILNANLSKP
jgi:tetratricopeptide (TPR) repeat protein/tRNA A-37 threonylcarbamoyl transferase component Bud32